jgi:hypothetical protein
VPTAQYITDTWKVRGKGEVGRGKVARTLAVTSTPLRGELLGGISLGSLDSFCFVRGLSLAKTRIVHLLKPISDGPSTVGSRRTIVAILLAIETAFIFSKTVSSGSSISVNSTPISFSIV